MESIAVRGTEKESADEWPRIADVGVAIRVPPSRINPATFLSLLFFLAMRACDRDVDKSMATPLGTALLLAEDKDAHVQIVSPARSEKSSRKLSPIIAVPRS